jgi:hypothetical protein
MSHDQNTTAFHFLITKRASPPLFPPDFPSATSSFPSFPSMFTSPPPLAIAIRGVVAVLGEGRERVEE